MQTIFAKKLGMSSRYTSDGARVGVTVVETIPLMVSGLRTKEKHGYNAILLELKTQKAKLKKTSKKPKIREVRTDETPEIGTEMRVEETLKPGDIVKVTGTSKGKGFAGVVKRYGFAGGPRSHGQSDRERAPGSSGSGTTPGRVYKGKRRAGHMGNVKVSVKGLKVLDVDAEKRLVTLIGAVPGSKNGLVEVTRI